MPSAFSSPSVRRFPLRPTIDQADAVDAVVRLLLDVGDVLVIDTKTELTDLSVRPAEQGENRVRKGKLPGHKQLPPATNGFKLDWELLYIQRLKSLG